MCVFLIAPVAPFTTALAVLHYNCIYMLIVPTKLCVPSVLDYVLITLIIPGWAEQAFHKSWTLQKYSYSFLEKWSTWKMAMFSSKAETPLAVMAVTAIRVAALILTKHSCNFYLVSKPKSFSCTTREMARHLLAQTVKVKGKPVGTHRSALVLGQEWLRGRREII